MIFMDGEHMNQGEKLEAMSKWCSGAIMKKNVI